MRAQGTGNTDCASLSYSGTLLASLAYDPLGRLFQIKNAAGTPTNFLYDGDALVLEYDNAGLILRRYVHGPNPGADDPLMWYEGAGVAIADGRYLYADPRGSIVLAHDRDGTVKAINSYDEYGIPGAGNVGRFQYTGQAWLPELGMYYYKARLYSPTLGRFLQTDPIGYEDQVNLYAYVANDPINMWDPTGLGCNEDDPNCSFILTPNSDGSVTVTRTETVFTELTPRPGIKERLRMDTVEQGSVKLLPQATAGGAPAPLKGDMLIKLLNLSESIDNRTVEVTSGYRSQEAQDRIRAQGNPRAAVRSPHTYNEAADIRVQGMAPADLADAAAASGEFARSNEYPNGGDVHVDQNTNARNQGRLCNYRPC